MSYIVFIFKSSFSSFHFPPVFYMERQINFSVDVLFQKLSHVPSFSQAMKFFDRKIGFIAYPSRTLIYFVQESCRSQTSNVTARILPLSYISDKTCQILADNTFCADSYRSRHFLPRSSKNNASSLRILKVKSDRFLQKMYGSYTGVCICKQF